MFSESQLLPISALQHLIFCERQAALIHIERIWSDNRLTVEGRHLHEKAHDGPDETRAGVRIARGVALRSLRLGLFGVADVVEFHSTDEQGRLRDPPVPFPVEYKRGRPKRHDADRVQLCAQALCLEEMLDRHVPRGALFYGRTRRRELVELDASLRALTQETTARLHQLIASGRTPAVRHEKRKCERCSLYESCLPEVTGMRKSVSRYLMRSIASTGASADSASDASAAGSQSR